MKGIDTKKCYFLAESNFIYGSILWLETVLLYSKLHLTVDLELLLIFPLSTMNFYSHVIKFLMK